MPKTSVNWSALLTEQGYEVKEIEVKDRTSTGFVSQLGKDYFFKAANLPEISEKIENEAKWYATVSPISSDLSVYIPRLFDQGSIGGLSWLVRESFSKDQQAANEGERSIADWFDNDMLVKTVNFIREIPTLPFEPLESEKSQSNQDPFFRAFTSNDQDEVNRQVDILLDQYLKEFAEVTTPIVKIVKEARLETGRLAYVDYKLWHFFRIDSKLTMIDAEHLSSRAPKYFDISYFYTHLFVTMSRPDLAEEALRYFVSHLNDVDKTMFISYFRPLVGRIGFMLLRDAVKDGRPTDLYLRLLSLVSAPNIL